MRGVNNMGVRMRSKVAGLGVTAAAVAAIAAVSCMSATASASAARPMAAGRVHVVAVTSAKTAAAAPATYTPPKRDLQEGMKGADVKALQQRLAALKYYPGAADGQFGGNTIEAVWAFQEVNGISATGVVGPSTKRALVHPRTYRAHNPGQNSTRVEVNLAMRVLVLFKSGKIYLISHVSTGGGYYYCSNGSCGYAITPTGTYYTTVYMPGWVQVPLGEMYNPVFFIGTAFAIHGDTYVPVYPASHGCVRVPMFIANFFHTLVKTPGTEVIVYN
jgi:peptidoglycan hydrolase-like protein with peptidoglycan-binding domain